MASSVRDWCGNDGKNGTGLGLIALLIGAVGLSACASPTDSTGDGGSSWAYDSGGLRFDPDGSVQLDGQGVADSSGGTDAGVQDTAGPLQDAGGPELPHGDTGGFDAAVADAGPGDLGTPDAGCPDCCTLGVCCDESTGKAKPAKTPCGSEPIEVQWTCEGATIRERRLLAGCDGVNAGWCGDDKSMAAWTPWQTLETCEGGKSCQVMEPGTKPLCPQTPKECTSHAQCADAKACTADLCDAGKCLHLPAAAGTPCGSAVLKTEYQCTSGKGGAVQVREAVAGCDGKTEGCPATGGPMGWQPWKTYKQCPYAQVCVLQAPDQPGTCGPAPTCTPGSTCCDAKGGWAAQGTQCGDQLVEEEFKCEGPALGGKLMVRKAYNGCSGSSSFCSAYYSQYLHWKDWEVSLTCKANEKCKLGYGGTSGKCDSAPECSPGGTCCGADGFYASKGVQCGTYAYKTESKCASADKGGKILTRKAFGGCSGTSTWCSSAADALVWGPWAETDSCKANEVCKPGWSEGSVSCEAAGTCNPYSACCSDAGEYEKKGVKCGSYANKTEYKCASADKGGKVLRRQAFSGCSGTSSSCSSQQADLVWDEWADYKTCKAYEVCEVSAYYGGCKDVSVCSPSASCCTEAGEYAPKGVKCGSWASKSEYKCSSPDKGAEVLVREAFGGCTGASGYCSTSSADLVWGPWTTSKKCAADELCKVTTYSGSCVWGG